MINIRGQRSGHVGLDGADSLPDRVADGQRVGRAVRLDDRLVETDESGAARLAVVHFLFERLDAVHAQKGSQPGQKVLLEHVLHHGGHEQGRTLDALQEDVAREAVGHDHVRAAERHVARFDVTGEIDLPGRARLLQKRIHRLLQFASLGILRADIEKGDAGILDAKHLFGVIRTHEGKLQEKFRRAVGGRTAVDEDDLFAGFGRDLRPHGRTADALDAAIEQYNADVAAARLAQWRNRCVSDGYEPGSTFKLITLASALDSGAITLNDSFYCGGKEKFAGRDQILNCWKSAGHGAQTTAQALGNSCNIAFGHIGMRMGGDTFYDYLKAFGIMEKTGVDLPGEGRGLFYDKKTLTDTATYGTSYLITSSFGQSFRITPMQLVRSVAAIVNGGYVLQPYVVSEVLDENGNTVQTNEKTVLRQVISQQTSETMRDLMEKVVTEGTASAAKTPGYRVGGKTGTSEKLDEYDENGQQVKDKIVSFVGVAPIDDPKYVVLVALDTPAYSQNSEKYTVHGMYISGGLMAAPTVRDIFLDILPYLGVEPDYSSEDIRGVNFTVPDVIGMNETEAAALLSEKTITYRTVGSGAVVTDQLPAAGNQVPGNSEIILYFGAEKQQTMVEVPDFIGCSVADVNYLAANAGLYVQAKGTDRTDVYVLAAYQDIEAGAEVDRGTTITVEFSSTGASD